MGFNLADLFERVADAVGDREAVVCDDRRLTYAELDERATRLANHLRDQGIGPRDHVGIYLFNSTEYLEAQLAAWKLRAVPVNVNYRYVEDELRYLLDNADVKALVFHRSFVPQVDAIRGDLPLLDHFIVVEDDGSDDLAGAVRYDDALAEASSERDFEPRSPDDLYILYTGGTTGLPKGVMWRHEDIFFAAMSHGRIEKGTETTVEEVVAAAKEGGHTSLLCCPFMHASGQWGGFATLFSGGKVIVWAGRSLDPPAIWEMVGREKPVAVTVVGDAVAVPLFDELERNRDRYDLSSLMAIGSGGNVLSPAMKERILALLPHLFVIDGFGSSETGSQAVTTSTKDALVRGVRFQPSDYVAVIDEDLRRVEPGSDKVGRVARRGNIPLGYYKDPDRTAETFVEIDGERWSLPGDLATVDADGTVTVLGRGSLVINTGGEKVYPDEVETVLKEHPAVADALVVGVPDDRWGQRVAAVVQPATGAELNLDDLNRHCRPRVAGYKIPRQLHLVDRVLRSDAGKPDYRWALSIAESEPVTAD